MALLDPISVGSQISPAQKESIHPSTRDRGHQCDLVVYGATLQGWNGNVGNLVAVPASGDAAFPKIHTSEYPAVRAQLDDFTYSPVSNGDRVKFVIVRTSAGDKTARSVTKI